MAARVHGYLPCSEGELPSGEFPSARSAALAWGRLRRFPALAVVLLAVSSSLAACAKTERQDWTLVMAVRQSNKVIVGTSYRRTITAEPVVIVIDTRKHGVLGDALVLSMGRGKKLFALVSVDGWKFWEPSSYADMPKCRANADIHDFRNFKPIDAYKLPPMVTFEDLSDPRSVRMVYADQISSEFDGDARLTYVGVCRGKLRGASEANIKDILPWMNDYERSHRTLEGYSSTDGKSLPSRLYPRDFSRH